MPGTDPTWDEHDESQGAFENLLERVTSQFTPNHNSQYEPGFVPAGSQNWNFQMGPDPGNNTYDQNAGVFPNRSFSVTQEPYVEMSHTPLNRSSSDLGARVNDYHSEVYQQIGSINQHSPMENFGSGFYSNPPSVIQSSSINTMPNVTGYDSRPSDSGLSYLPQNSHSFATKLSNFTATLGTWASPFECKNPKAMDSIDESYQPGSPEDYNKSSLDPETYQHSSYDVNSIGVLPVNAKPSYSDVLSKAPSLDKMNFNGNQIHQSKNLKNHQHPKHKNENFKHSSSSTKHKNRYNSNNNNNNSQGRCNSPSLIVNGTNVKGSQKMEQISKVGLDNFDVSGTTHMVNQNVTDMKANNTHTNKNCIIESGSKANKRGDSLSSSPAHQSKKNKREKYEDWQDTLEKSSDQLNNHVLSNQKKQALKKPSFINNVLNSPNANSSGSIKRNNSDFITSNSSKKSSNFRDTKSDYDLSDSGSKKESSTGSSSFSCYGSKESESSVRSGPTARTYRNFGSKTDKNKDSLKKSASRRKREESLGDHSEILLSLWGYLKLWLHMVARAGAWLLMITLDVIHMSYGLFMQMSRESLDAGCVYWMELKKGAVSYGRSVLNYFKRKKENTPGSSERKVPDELTSNIPLPPTGEAAMKRLLAGRGKDAYSILGVTRTCSDEDIKKYYKRQAFLVHPDKNKQPGAEEAFKILAHAFELIGEPDRRAQYDAKLSEEVQMEGAWSELSLLMTRLREKLEEAANTIRCTNCSKRHKRVKQERPVYGARYCAECQFMHAAREGDIWAERTLLGLRWRYYACMEGAIYDISEWASCQRENLKHLQANTHSVQYRIVSGKKNATGKNASPECPTEPELEEFFHNLCLERFGQDFVSSNTFKKAVYGKRKAKKRK